MLPPAWTGTRNGSAPARARRRTRAGARTATPAPPIAADADAPPRRARARPWSRTVSTCGESQISATSSTGVSTSAPSIAHARPRTVRPSTAPAASSAASDHARDEHPLREGGGLAHRSPSERIRGGTPRRMSTMLRVTCATFGLAEVLRPLRQPDADHGALAELHGGQRRAAGRGRLAGRLRLRPPPRRQALADRGQQLPAAERRRLLQPREARQRQRALHQPVGRLAVVLARARPARPCAAPSRSARRTGRPRPAAVARESVPASSVVAHAQAHAAAQRVGAEHREPCRRRSRTCAAAAPSGRVTQRSEPASSTPLRSLARGLRVRSRSRSLVRS